MPADYTEQVSLPSKGLLYPGNPELSGPITIRMMTIEDEKKVFGSSGEDVTKTLLNRCIVSPKFDPDTLVAADRHFLLMALRVFTYGADYHVKYKCPCGFTGEATIDINRDLVVHELPDDYKEPFEITLPVAKKVVGVKTLTTEEVNRIRASAKLFAKKTSGNAGEREFMLRQIERIVTIDGKEATHEEKDDLVSNMVGRDSAYIAAKIDGVKLGYDYLITVKCAGCGEDCDTVFEITSEFFRPRFD